LFLDVFFFAGNAKKENDNGVLGRWKRTPDRERRRKSTSFHIFDAP